MPVKELIAPVSFDDSMARNDFFSSQRSLTHYQFQIVRKLYEAYQQKVVDSSTYIIPKLIHLIWLGSPLPERYSKFLESWKRFHPSWEVKLWTEKDVDSFKFKNKRAFDQAVNFGEKSDIWRYEILYLFGGLYVDCDFECLKAFDGIHQSCEFYAGLSYETYPSIYNALIGCIPGHPILKRSLEMTKVSARDHNLMRIMTAHGPTMFTNAFYGVVEQASDYLEKVVVFPVSYFYPFPNYLRNTERDLIAMKKKWISPESFALHYWSKDWQSIDSQSGLNQS
jgi:mannosyltransferase OCH1-like enzyme